MFRKQQRTANHGQQTIAKSPTTAVPRLAAFADEKPKSRHRTENLLPIDFASYLALVDWTGRAIRHDKKGSIPDNVAPILMDLGIEKTQWVTGVQQFNLDSAVKPYYDRLVHGRCARKLKNYRSPYG